MPVAHIEKLKKDPSKFKADVNELESYWNDAKKTAGGKKQEKKDWYWGKVMNEFHKLIGLQESFGSFRDFVEFDNYIKREVRRIFRKGEETDENV